MATKVNKVDYDVLEKGVKVYSKQAAKIEDALNVLITMNNDLQEGWTNDTSDAFIDRFQKEHKPALKSARDSIQSISDYISKYLESTQNADRENANNIRG